MKIDYNDLNTYGILATFIGLIISFITLKITSNVRRATRELQNSLAFDKRVPGHLRQMDLLLKNFNSLLNNVDGNINEIQIVLSNLKSELISMSLKVNDKTTTTLISIAVKNVTYNLNREFRLKSFSKRNRSTGLIQKLLIWSYISNITEDNYWKNYIQINEVYATVHNLYKDKKVKIKSND